MASATLNVPDNVVAELNFKLGGIKFIALLGEKLPGNACPTSTGVPSKYDILLFKICKSGIGLTITLSI